MLSAQAVSCPVICEHSCTDSTEKVRQQSSITCSHPSQLSRFPIFFLLQGAHGRLPGSLSRSSWGIKKRGEVAQCPANAGPGGPVQRGCQGKLHDRNTELVSLSSKFSSCFHGFISSLRPQELTVLTSKTGNGKVILNFYSEKVISSKACKRWINPTRLSLVTETY